MKISDLKVGEAYYYAPYTNPTKAAQTKASRCVVVLDTKYQHRFHGWREVPSTTTGTPPLAIRIDEYRPGRKAVEGDITASGIPVMVAHDVGHVHARTEWSLHLVNPIYLHFLWSEVSGSFKSIYDSREGDRIKREEEKQQYESALLRAKTALRAAAGHFELTQQNGFGRAYIIFQGERSLNWLADFIERAQDLEEEVKDLRYELED